MRVLDIRTDLGPGVTPAHLEALIRGIRVATDVAHDAEVDRLRRAVSERMKFPTDVELRAALEQLPEGGESSPRARARRQLDARNYTRKEFGRFPPDLWFGYLYRAGRSRQNDDSPMDSRLSAAGYDRIASTPYPLAGAVGLDAIDPELYAALVADELARNLPERVGVRQLQYQNPFWTALFGRKAAEHSVSTTAEVIEVARDYRAMRKIGKAEAAVAEATVGNRIVERDIDVALRQEELRQAQLMTERLALENAALRQSLGAEEQRRGLIDSAVRHGDLSVADAIRALDSADVQALSQLGHRQLEITERAEPDEEAD